MMKRRKLVVADWRLEEEGREVKEKKEDDTGRICVWKNVHIEKYMQEGARE